MRRQRQGTVTVSGFFRSLGLLIELTIRKLQMPHTQCDVHCTYMIQQGSGTAIHTYIHVCGSVQSLEEKLGVLLPWNIHTREIGLQGVYLH